MKTQIVALWRLAAFSQPVKHMERQAEFVVRTDQQAAILDRLRVLYVFTEKETDNLCQIKIDGCEMT